MFFLACACVVVCLFESLTGTTISVKRQTIQCLNLHSGLDEDVLRILYSTSVSRGNTWLYVKVQIMSFYKKRRYMLTRILKKIRLLLLALDQLFPPCPWCGEGEYSREVIYCHLQKEEERKRIKEKEPLYACRTLCIRVVLGDCIKTKRHHFLEKRVGEYPKLYHTFSPSRNSL